MDNSKIKFNSLICSILFFIFFLYNLPTYSAAVFSDSVSVDAGIKLTLGNLWMAESTSFFNNNMTVTADSLDQTVLTTTLTNGGTLMGKMGYKIESDITSDLRDAITFSLYEGDLHVADLEQSGNYLFLNQNSEDIIFEPGSQKTYSIKLKADALPVETQHFQIALSFILSQTNAKEPKKMFNDEVTFDPITVVLEGETANPDTGWPMDNDPRWKTDSNTGVRYINELETEIMYFSETKDGTRIKNLDNLSIYIDYSKGNQKWNFIQVSTLDSPFEVKEEWSDGKVRIDVSLDADANQYNQSTTIGDDSYEMKFQFQSNANKVVSFKGALFAKRLLLTSDNADYHNNANYYKDILPVYTSKQGTTIRLAYIQNNTYSPLTSLSESALQLSEYRIRFDVQKVNAMIANVDKSSNSIKVKVADFVSDLGEIKRMSIFITGSSGQELKIERNVKALPIDVNMQIPTNWYAIGDNRIKINTQQMDVPLVEQKEADGIYFVSNETDPPVLYLMNSGNHYFGFEYDKMWAGQEIKEIVYSPDLKVMRITFSFKVSDLQLNNNGKQFSFKISNGVGYMIYYHQITLNFIPVGDMMSSERSVASFSDSSNNSTFSVSESIEAQATYDSIEADALDLENVDISSSESERMEEIVSSISSVEEMVDSEVD